MKILVVEDEKLLADSLKALLKSKGFQVETVYDGISGAEYAELGVYDLLTVASPGEALDRQQLRDIFKRFYRVDKARSRDGSYGLGLSIAQRIVEEHRGRIWAESSQGVNTFCVQLPQS